jgi:phosphatidate cytidylyltransferase
MLIERILVGMILLPLAGIAIFLGGWVYAIVITLILGVAGWEYWRMVRNGGYSPSSFLIVGGIVVLSLVRHIFPAPGFNFTLNFLILATMAASVYHYELGQTQPALNFAFNLVGLIYLGWIGSYLIPLRSLPNGLWWVAVSLPAAWAGDIGAYFIGSLLGRHRLAPRVSPRKSWEGYFGGLPFAMAWSIGLATMAHSHVSVITTSKGAILGLVIGLTAPLGDLFESLLKRQFGIKDSSHILLGHGGVMDRIDSTVWTGVVSYFLITLFLL